MVTSLLSAPLYADKTISFVLVLYDATAHAASIQDTSTRRHTYECTLDTDCVYDSKQKNIVVLVLAEMLSYQ